MKRLLFITALGVLMMSAMSYGVFTYTDTFDDPADLGWTYEVGAPDYSTSGYMTMNNDDQMVRFVNAGSFEMDLSVDSLSLKTGTLDSFYYRLYDGSDVLTFLIKEATDNTFLVRFEYKVGGATTRPYSTYLTASSPEDVDFDIKVLWDEPTTTFTCLLAWDGGAMTEVAYFNYGRGAANGFEWDGRHERLFFTGEVAGADEPSAMVDYYSLISGVPIPTPADGEKGVSSTVILEWEDPGTYDPNYYDVYFGSEPNLLDPNYDIEKIITQQDVNQADPLLHSTISELELLTTYYWRLDVYEPNSVGPVPIKHEGPIWSFTTGQVCDPPLLMDYNDDCNVDFQDFAQLAAEWLSCNWKPVELCL